MLLRAWRLGHEHPFPLTPLATWQGDETGVSGMCSQWLAYKRHHQNACPAICLVDVKMCFQCDPRTSRTTRLVQSKRLEPKPVVLVISSSWFPFSSSGRTSTGPTELNTELQSVAEDDPRTMKEATGWVGRLLHGLKHSIIEHIMLTLKKKHLEQTLVCCTGFPNALLADIFWKTLFFEEKVETSPGKRAQLLS